jgi:PPIC-type PPIASE domain
MNIYKLLVAAFAGVLAFSCLPVSAAEPLPTMDSETLVLVNGEPIRLKDLERAIYYDEHQDVKKKVLPFLIQELIVQQQVSRKEISVKSKDVDDYMKNIDLQMRRSGRKSLDKYLSEMSMSKEFFRRKIETTIGLYYLAKGRQRPAVGLADVGMQKKMNSMLERFAKAAQVVQDAAKIPEDVAALVNGEKITIREAGRVARMIFSPKVKALRLKQQIRFVIVRQEFEGRKLSLTKDDLDYQVQLASASRVTKLGEAVFSMEKILSQLGRDIRLLKKQYGFKRVSMLTKMIRKDIKEKNLERFFRESPRMFGHRVPKASHILLRTVDDKGRRLPRGQCEKAQRLIKELRVRIVKQGEDFAKLAADLSQDNKTAEVGGNRGFLDPSLAAKDPVVAIAYRLNVGDVSKPIQSPLGWHLVKVTEISKVSYKEARPMVLATTSRSLRNTLERQLTAKAKVVVSKVRY